LFNDAVPPEPTLAVPRVAAPSANVTVPVVFPEPDATVTVAVRVTAFPAMPGWGVALTAVAVGVRFTVWAIDADDGPLF
jgi:hypothetical protein